MLKGTTQEPLVVIFTEPGLIFHKAGCKHIKRDTIGVFGMRLPNIALPVGTEWSHLAMEEFGDVASDESEYGTPEHTALVEEYFLHESVISPCVTFPKN